MKEERRAENKHFYSSFPFIELFRGVTARQSRDLICAIILPIGRTNNQQNCLPTKNFHSCFRSWRLAGRSIIFVKQEVL